MHMNVVLNNNERLEDLHRDGLLLIQNIDKFCFGCDAVLLSDFAKVKKNEIALDIGTGNGVIPILLTAKTMGKFFYGLEIQKENALLAQKNILINNLTTKVQMIHGDVKQLNNFFKKSFFDVITTNPPYIKNTGGIKNESYEKSVARHEILCDLNDIITKSAQHLKTNGRFYMIHRPDRLVEIINLMSKNNLEPKQLRYVYPNINKEPKMILIEGVKNGKAYLKNLPPLIMYNQDGSYTDEVKKIYYE